MFPDPPLQRKPDLPASEVEERFTAIDITLKKPKSG